MSAYVSGLRACVEAQVTEHTAKKKEAAELTARERLIPLEGRLRKVLCAIPPEVQSEGFSLRALQVQLKGRWRGNVHPGELGSALRKLGYQRRRQWSGSDEFRALWFPQHVKK